MDEQELALAELEALVKVPGALKIITSEIRPELRQDPDDPRSPVREDVAPEGGEEGFVRADELLRSPATFVLHDVTRLEASAHLGMVRAHSAEGDWTEGRPTALLKRLREWRG